MDEEYTKPKTALLINLGDESNQNCIRIINDLDDSYTDVIYISIFAEKEIDNRGNFHFTEMTLLNAVDVPGIRELKYLFFIIQLLLIINAFKPYVIVTDTNLYLLEIVARAIGAKYFANFTSWDEYECTNRSDMSNIFTCMQDHLRLKCVLSQTPNTYIMFSCFGDYDTNYNFIIVMNAFTDFVQKYHLMDLPVYLVLGGKYNKRSPSTLASFEAICKTPYFSTYRDHILLLDDISTNEKQDILSFSSAYFYFNTAENENLDAVIALNHGLPVITVKDTCIEKNQSNMRNLMVTESIPMNIISVLEVIMKKSTDLKIPALDLWRNISC